MSKRSVLLFSIMMLTVSVSWRALGFTGEYKNPYYKKRPQFHFYPAHDIPRYPIGRIGPTGIHLELRQPAFTMHVVKVDGGSPAAGKVKPGQIIESINGKTLKDVDPRIILGNLVTEAEAKDGKLIMQVKDNAKADPKEVVVQLEALGKYSDSWPMKCKKSDKIVRNFAKFLAKHPNGYGSALFLLSTGEEEDLEVVRRWFKGRGTVSGHPWDIGYNGPAVCEYYLRTGDESVLPGIKAGTEKLKKTIYNGSWMGRGGCNYNYMAGGHMNAAGVHCLTFLLLAKECGVDVDEHTMQSCLYHFYRYAGHWNVSYGDGLPEGGGVDNGKNGGLAFAMAAAATLHPAGEKSVYAKARDISANKSFYTTSWLFHGHTGGGIGEIWRGAAAGLLAEKRPEMYRSFMDERRWMYELARTCDHAFGWGGGQNVSYNTTGHRGGRSWGNLVGLIYTIPRKKLLIYGAPRTKYCKTYKIPDRPWGTKADEAFYDVAGGEYKPGKKQDMSKETIPTHASMPLMGLMANPKITDDDLLMFAHHCDSTGRGIAGGNINSQKRFHLIVPLLKSKDARGRITGLRAAAGSRKGGATPIEMTDEVIKLVGDMISDPNESWWVVMEALKLLRLAPADKIAPYSDKIAFWLKHEDWWLKHAALVAVTPIAADKRFYKKVLPIVGDMVRDNTRAVSLGPLRGIVAALQKADPEVQAFAVEQLGKAYTGFPTEFTAPGGQNMSACVDYLLRGVASNLANTPGGFDKLYEVSKKRFPNQVLPHKELYMGADFSKFGPVVKKALQPIVMQTLIPKYIAYGDYRGSNAELLKAEVASIKPKKNYRGPKLDALVSLYRRVGVFDYDWKDFGPGRTEIKWSYHSYDPVEEKLWEKGFRYRKVSPPKGMEDWNKKDFDAKAANWKTGQAPFGQFGGKLAIHGAGCKQPFCMCSLPLKTMWEKEVLLIQAKIKFPAFKKNHRYRICVGGMSHVQGGDGFEIYVNGKPMFSQKNGIGKRAGGRPVCFYIDQTWWPAFKDEVTIAAKGFCPIPGGKRSPGVKKQHFSIFLQEMKCPPITDEMIARGKTMQPMRCTAWQATKKGEDMFNFDGDFKANSAVLGKWKLIGQVASEMNMDLAKMTPAADGPAKLIELKGKGQTHSKDLFWSGSTLMDLKDLVAKKMTHKKIKGKDYLFIEAGGFSKKDRRGWKPDHPADWKPALQVFEKK